MDEKDMEQKMLEIKSELLETEINLIEYHNRIKKIKSQEIFLKIILLITVSVIFGLSALLIYKLFFV